MTYFSYIKKYIKFKTSLFIVANCNTLEKCYVNCFSKSRKNIREMLQTTLFNSCVQSALPFFVLYINGAFLLKKLLDIYLH